MNKNFIIGLVILVIIGIGAYFFMSQNTEETETSQQPQTQEATFDGRNASFTVDDKSVTLANGVSETPIEDSSAKITTRYFGNEARGDLNYDGKDDVSFLVTQDTGGSGTFYYAVVAYTTKSGYKTTNAFLVGDRIAPQTSRIPQGSYELQVNYATRKSGEPMTAQPSEGKTLLLKVTPSGVLEGLMR